MDAALPDVTCSAARDGTVCIVTIMRPHKRNALTLEMFSALADRLEAAQDDVSVRVVVLCGAGGHYTAGHDLEDFTRWPQHPGDPVPRALHALASLSKPVVIAVHGVAMGFGATSLLHADWSVGSADARLRLPFSYNFV